MKILFVWSGLTGYMGAGWRRLSEKAELKVSVDVGEKTFGGRFQAEKVMAGIDWSGRLPEGWRPDVVFVVGWHNPLCVSAAKRRWGKDVKLVFCFDMPWRANLRCVLAKFLLWPYLRRFSAALVSGKSASRYAKWLGFRDIYQGVYNIDVARFTDAAKTAQNRKGFLFVGRKVMDKGVDILKQAYDHYRRDGGQWELAIPEWIDPDEVPQVMARYDCLILPSRWEPWGVVVLEAKAAGMKVLVSDRVGARLDVPVDGVFRSGDTLGLAGLMKQAEEGALATTSSDVRFWDCETWSNRVISIAKDVMTKRSSK